MDKEMKANPDKCHFICSTNDTVNLIVENQIINNSKCEKLLGVKLNDKLTFNAHIDAISKKAGLKLKSISSIAPYKDLKKRLLMNAFFLSQFSFIVLCFECVIIEQKVTK